jgi:stage V sporulation protein G
VAVRGVPVWDNAGGTTGYEGNIRITGIRVHGGAVRGDIMEITEVRIFPVHEERLKAYVTITLDGCFVVRDLKIVRGNTGLFVAMPAKRRRDGTFKDIAHPLNSDTRAWMEERILAAYRDEVGEDETSAPAGAPDDGALDEPQPALAGGYDDD